MLCCFQAVDGAGKDSTTPMRGAFIISGHESRILVV